MGTIQQVTPEAVLDLYNTLSDKGQNEFIRMVGNQSTAEDVAVLMSGLCPEEGVRLADQLSEPFAGFFEEQELHALDAADALPAGSREERRAFLKARVVEYRTKLSAGVTKMVGIELNAMRNRHADPDTVSRNLEVCRLRRSNPKLWSYGALAKKFEVSKEYIRKVLKAEAKWRRAAPRASTN